MNIMPQKAKVTYSGTEMELYSIGWIALLSGRTNVTVRKWALAGYLPAPLLSVSKLRKCRWYLLAEVLGYVEIVKRCNIRRNVRMETTSFKEDARLLRETLRHRLLLNPASFNQRLSATALEKVLDEQKKKHNILVAQAKGETH